MTAFPEKCNTCGRTVENAEEIVLETVKSRPSVSGLKQSIDDDGSMIVELFRNCICGSTLIDAFNDRQGLPSKGEERRKRFAELQTFLVEEHAVDSIVARNELLKVMGGERSKILSKTLPPKK
ncbi:MAG: hypothetical protein ACJA0C_000285 [Candidatus Endobugula sp.]|jgi:hypothetical protein